MATECKLCALLGATLTDASEGNSEVLHDELHIRQSQLIGKNHTELTTENTQIVLKNESQTGARRGDCPKERSINSALCRLGRELFNIYGKTDCGMKCSQCSLSIRSDSPGHTARTLINHACIHLNKDLFACRHCDFKFVSEPTVHYHLRRIHSLSSIRANYIDMMDDHQSDIIDMLKLCFGKGPQKQLKVTPFRKRKKNNPCSKDPLLKLAYACVDKHTYGLCFNCNLCPTEIPNNNRWHTSRRLLDHTRWHLDKPIYACRLCQYSASTRGTVTSHLNQSHSVATSKQNFKDESSEYFEEISSMLEDCFGDVKKETPHVISMEEKRTRVGQSCIRSKCGANTLLAERQLRCRELSQRFQRSGKLVCRICHVHLNIVTEAFRSYVQAPMRHVLAHFNKLLFSCRRCSHTSTTKHAMEYHVRSKHGVSATNEFDDRTDDFHADFMVMLSKCFDWDLEPEKSEAATVTPKNPLWVTSRTQSNDLKAARHIHALELIRNHAKDGKMICRICSHSTPAKSRNGSVCLFNHAVSHLDKSYWPYRCKLCSCVTVNQANIDYHLKSFHKRKGTKEFENMSDKFHSEIMNMLSKCYGEM